MALNPGEEVIPGVVLANVAGGVSAGTELGVSSTEGELASGSGGVSALTDEGAMAGLSSKESVPAGYAGVRCTAAGPVSYEAGEAVSPGDVVAINGGQLATADGTTDTNLIGVVGHGGGEDAGSDYASGEDAPVYIIE
jgi:hypothetical protein